MGARGIATAGTPTRADSVEAATFKKLIVRQEEQIRLLEAINKRKEEQILDLHTRVESVLGMLDAGQEAYQTQQGLMLHWTEVIAGLRARVAVAGVADKECAANHAQSVAGWAKAAKTA